LSAESSSIAGAQNGRLRGESPSWNGTGNNGRSEVGADKGTHVLQLLTRKPPVAQAFQCRKCQKIAVRYSPLFLVKQVDHWWRQNGSPAAS